MAQATHVSSGQFAVCNLGFSGFFFLQNFLSGPCGFVQSFYSVSFSRFFLGFSSSPSLLYSLDVV